MSKLSFIDKLGILIDVTMRSKIYILALVLLIIIAVILINTNKKNKNRKKLIYLIISVFVLVYFLFMYASSLSTMFDYMMNNLFIIIYFPNIAIYTAAIIITNIIVWISIFSYKTSKYIKRLNIVIYIIMNYLLLLILNVINNNNLDVFTQSSIYENKEATALIELSSIVFMVWIIFLIIYKIILIYLKKEYKPPVKKIIIKKSVKKLPNNYEPVNIPDYVYGNLNRKVNNNYQSEPKIIETKEINIKEKELINQLDKSLTLNDYKILLKLLKEKKKQEKNESEKIIIHQKEIIEEAKNIAEKAKRDEEIARKKLEEETNRINTVENETKKYNDLLNLYN